MNIKIKDVEEALCICEVLILPLLEEDTESSRRLTKGVSSLLKKVFSKEFSAKQNELLLIPAPDDIRAERILLVGFGRKKEISRERIRQAGGKAAAYLRDMGIKRAALSTRLISSLRFSPADFIEGFLLGVYTFDRFRSERKKKEVEAITVIARPSRTLKDEIRWIGSVSDSVCFARDLINTPSNKMTPTALARAAKSLMKRKVSVRILNKKDAQRLGMGAYLSVARGSAEPPRFIVVDYKGARGKPLVLIGKSVTFDSGGVSLKPAEGMEKMKYDMAGGAAVLGVMKAVSERELPVRLVGILPATENLPGGSASKPGDIVRSITGKTVEIINTDAEGRLILADAIGYAKRLKPRAIIDIATLTGACTVTFGSEAIAMMGNDRGLIDLMKKSAESTYERVWEMPLFEEYKDYIKSDIADIKNFSGRNGALMTSAYFLYEFSGRTPWIHLDIAGTAWTEKDRPYMPKGATGGGVRLIVNFIRELT